MKAWCQEATAEGCWLESKVLKKLKYTNKLENIFLHLPIKKEK